MFNGYGACVSEALVKIADGLVLEAIVDNATNCDGEVRVLNEEDTYVIITVRQTKIDYRGQLAVVNFALLESLLEHIVIQPERKINLDFSVEVLSALNELGANEIQTTIHGGINQLDEDDNHYFVVPPRELRHPSSYYRKAAKSYSQSRLVEEYERMAWSKEVQENALVSNETLSP